MAKDLRTFLEELREKLPGNYLEVSKEISSQFETTALLKHLEDRKNYSTVLFKNVKNIKGNSGNLVVSNLTATRENMAIAAGLSPEQSGGDLTREVSALSKKIVSPQIVPAKEAPEGS